MENDKLQVEYAKGIRTVRLLHGQFFDVDDLKKDEFEDEEEEEDEEEIRNKKYE